MYIPCASTIRKGRLACYLHDPPLFLVTCRTSTPDFLVTCRASTPDLQAYRNRAVACLQSPGASRTCSNRGVSHFSWLGRLMHSVTEVSHTQVILAPSRELANQIYEEALTFCKYMNIR